MLTMAPDVVEEEEVAVEVVTGQAPVSDGCFVVFRAPTRPSTNASSNMTSSVYEAELRRLDNFVRGDGASGQSVSAMTPGSLMTQNKKYFSPERRGQ